MADYDGFLFPPITDFGDMLATIFNSLYTRAADTTITIDSVSYIIVGGSYEFVLDLPAGSYTLSFMARNVSSKFCFILSDFSTREHIFVETLPEIRNMVEQQITINFSVSYSGLFIGSFNRPHYSELVPAYIREIILT